MIKRLPEGDLESFIKENNFVLKFAASWCQPCKAVEPVVIKACGIAGAELYEVDVDAQPDVAAAFGVRNVPTVIAIAGGEAKGILVGAQTEEMYTDLAFKSLD